MLRIAKSMVIHLHSLSPALTVSCRLLHLGLTACERHMQNYKCCELKYSPRKSFRRCPLMGRKSQGYREGFMGGPGGPGLQPRSSKESGM